MKNSKKLKLILRILICILITLLGTVGIYTKQTNEYKNLLPHTYTLGSDINGITAIQFKPDDSKNTVYYDKDGNEVDSTKITKENEKDYEKKETPINKEENLNSANFITSLNIMKKRLDFFDVEQYQIDLDEKTGTIYFNVEDKYLEDKLAFILTVGSLQLIDSNTGDIIIDHTNFKTVEATYASLRTQVITYFNFKLNDSGIEKINNIDKYKAVKTEEDKQSKESSIIVMFDSEKIAEVSYEDILLTGKTLRVTTASGLTSDTEINSQINMGIIVSKIATMGKMPVIYTLTAESYIQNDIGNSIDYIIISVIALAILVSIIIIFRHKLKGLLGVLGFATNISIFLLIIRFTNLQISLNGFAGMFGLIILNMLLINNILKCTKNGNKVFYENVKDAYLKSLNPIIIMLIIFVVFALSSMTVINTMGLLLFWGWLITVLGTLIFTVPCLDTSNN